MVSGEVDLASISIRLLLVFVELDFQYTSTLIIRSLNLAWISKRCSLILNELLSNS